MWRRCGRRWRRRETPVHTAASALPGVQEKRGHVPAVQSRAAPWTAVARRRFGFASRERRTPLNSDDMTFLPIVERELRVASRRRGTYFSRATVALVAILVLCGTLWFEGRVAPRELGKDVFNILSGMLLFSSLVAGVRYTSDSLSEEKREGTLGLLFLTDLHGYDVVLGKLAATSLDAFYALLAVFPILAVTFMMRGVTGTESWRTFLALVSAVCVSFAEGMIVLVM